MAKKTEERKEVKEDVIFKACADSNASFSKLWEDSYLNLYKPWIGSMGEMFDKTANLSKEATPQKYKEFYDLCVSTYKETYGNFVKSMEPKGEMFENFEQSTTIYLGMYKSWIAALENMSEKAKELSTQTSDPQAFKEFSNPG
jgi:hypothetical protein